jgi:hypothetical protein
MLRTDFSNNYMQSLLSTTENLLTANTFTNTLFYRGQVTDRLHLYGDISYNFYNNDLNNDYTCQDVNINHYTDKWNEYKYQNAINLDGKYRLSDRMTVEAGYSNSRRIYESGSNRGVGFLDYNEYRNKAFVYLSCFLSDKTGLKFGIAPEHIRLLNTITENRYVRWLPYLQVNHKINRWANLSAGYATNQSYPSLHQLSPMSIVVDTFLTQVGNQSLVSAVRHQAFAELTLWNKLKIMPQYHFIRDGISEVYDVKEYKFYRTFDNMNFRTYSVQASFEQSFGTSFRLKNDVMLYRSDALRGDSRSSIAGWTCHFEGDYYDEAKSFGMKLGYYRNMRKNMLWRGDQMSDKDYWCITARKELWRNRLSATLSYIPPLAFGVRYAQTKEINTSLYKERTTLNLQSYNQMLLLKVSLRLEQKAVRQTNNRFNERER